MAVQLTDASVIANNEVVGVTPNSVKFTEGFGEQSVRVMASGGGKTEPVIANNVETNKGKFMFAMPATVDNIKLARQWKSNPGQNVFQVAGSTVEGDVNRTFTQATVVNDYEVPVATEGDIELEIEGNSPI